MKKTSILIFFLILSFTLPLHAKEAKFYETLLSGDIQCLLCPRACILKKDAIGICRTRKNVNGKLETLVYARVCSSNIDPVEKKPLFHFLPGTPILSIATPGCNLRCVFCQNWSISQAAPHEVRTTKLLPEDIVRMAQEKKCPSIAYTYSEPTVFYEYMYDTSWLAKENKIKNVWVTCGYINPEPLRELCSVIHAANVDLKGFTNKVYRWVAGAKVEPVLETLKILKEEGVWLEVGYLVIPTINDDMKDIDALLAWYMENLGPNVPLHLLRFFPQHKLTHLPPTPVATLEKIHDAAKKAGIKYVYLGNVPGHKANHTYCPKCGKMLIERKGYFLNQLNIVDGACKFCGEKIPGVWK